MKRSTVYIISGLIVAAFIGIAYFAWMNRWGPEGNTVVPEPPTYAMRYMDRSLSLMPADFDDTVWQQVVPFTVDLIHQVTVSPRGKNLVPKIALRAFHNKRDAYFMMEWRDDHESHEHDLEEFPDAAAIGFSLEKSPPKRSLMMGFDSPINIWQWKSDLDVQTWRRNELRESFTPNMYYTYEQTAAFPRGPAEVSSACQDLVAIRPGTLTRKETGSLSGRGLWRDGRWRVIITRTLTTEGNPEQQIQLSPGNFHIALAVWDGDKSDRGSRKSISDWIILSLE